MKQQLLENALREAREKTKTAKFKIEFGLMMLGCGRETEAQTSMTEGLTLLAEAIQATEIEANVS